ncbi:MAG: aminopeptidase P family protein [Alphaproteobacteria bacterium]|nr:aminopeptidase P family protein [Alphaproteobacteria bacterium]
MQEIAAQTKTGRAVTLRFERAEFEARLARARSELKRRGLAALLVYGQETHLYLAGFDTGGFVFYQVGIVTADDRPLVLLTRRPDLAQARDTSLYDDIRLWFDAEDQKPAEDLRAILAELGLKGERIGIELATYGLTGFNHQITREALDGFCTLVDVSDIVRTQRVAKSPAEIAYVRAAAKLADDAIEAMVAAARPGVIDSAITAAGVSAMLAGGGDMPASGPLVNSGRRAVYGRGIGGPRRLDAQDQVMLELAASYCRYNVCIEHTVAIGTPRPRQVEMFGVARDTLAAMTDVARPGEPIGRIAEVFLERLDKAGFARQRFAACGYSLGATFRPTWMDVPPMIYAGNRMPLQPGMTLFPHVMLGDMEAGVAAGVGWTILITDKGAEVLSRLPLELHRR